MPEFYFFKRQVHKNVRKIFRGISRTSSLIVTLSVVSHNCFAYEGIDISDPRPFQEPPSIKIVNSTLFIDGQITTESASKITNTLKQKNINRVSINSLGGDVESAIKISEMIKKEKIDIDVRSICASACANYIFPSAREKYLTAHSLLLWHGSVNSPEKYMVTYGNSRKEILQSPELRKIRSKEIFFYKTIHVGYQLPYCPQLKPDYQEKFPERWFSYMPSDIAKFGIKSVHYASGPSQWVSYARSQHVIFADYCN